MYSTYLEACRWFSRSTSLRGQHTHHYVCISPRGPGRILAYYHDFDIEPRERLDLPVSAAIIVSLCAWSTNFGLTQQASSTRNYSLVQYTHFIPHVLAEKLAAISASMTTTNPATAVNVHRRRVTPISKTCTILGMTHTVNPTKYRSLGHPFTTQRHMSLLVVEPVSKTVHKPWPVLIHNSISVTSKTSQ